MMKQETPIHGLPRNKTKSLWLFVVLSLTLSLQSQRIQNIRLSSAGGIVRVDFTVLRGTNCDGYKILHSTDSTFFNVVGDYPGLCSSTFEDLSHSFNHNNPQLNTVNFYKIELAFVETSDIQRIYVSSDNRALLTPYPNPVLLSDGFIHFKTSNTENGLLEGFVCDESGHQLSTLLVNCYNYTISLPIYYLKSGIYFIWLSDGIFIYGTKFIVSP